ncbi:MAG: hypothetical protein ACI9JY_001542, partial [Saprospiraceae bacterium]
NASKIRSEKGLLVHVYGRFAAALMIIPKEKPKEAEGNLSTNNSLSFKAFTIGRNESASVIKTFKDTPTYLLTVFFTLNFSLGNIFNKSLISSISMSIYFSHSTAKLNQVLFW